MLRLQLQPPPNHRVAVPKSPRLRKDRRAFLSGSSWASRPPSSGVLSEPDESRVEQRPASQQIALQPRVPCSGRPLVFSPQPCACEAEGH